MKKNKQDGIKYTKICVMKIPRDGRYEVEKYSNKEIIADNFSNLMKNFDLPLRNSVSSMNNKDIHTQTHYSETKWKNILEAQGKRKMTRYMQVIPSKING